MLPAGNVSEEYVLAIVHTSTYYSIGNDSSFQRNSIYTLPEM